MKASELRIGNLVNLPDSVKKDYWECSGINIITNHLEVTVIYKDEVNLLILDDEEEFDIKELEPIELTEEWLVKFWFVNISKLTFEKSDILIDLENNSCWLHQDWNDFNIGIIKYVHQLQNLYFALTGKELETK